MMECVALNGKISYSEIVYNILLNKNQKETYYYILLLLITLFLILVYTLLYILLLILLADIWTYRSFCSSGHV